MAKNFEIKINGKKYKVSSDDTILQIAKKNNLKIPTLCHHPDLPASANCRLCLVEIAFAENNRVVTACSTKASEGMEVRLDTKKVKLSRKLNLEMLLSDHIKKCPDCNWLDNCELKKLAEEFGIKNSRFTERRRHFKIDAKTPSIFWDSSKCIECGNCVSACNEIAGLSNIESKYRSHSIIFGPVGGKSFADTDCIFCGQCVVHCPAGSLQEKSSILPVKKLLEKKNKKDVLIAQFAPSTRYSIGELFGEPAGKNLEYKLVTALKKLGFDYVFDVNFGADITTLEEAAELEERLQTKRDGPMFTSCCPAWVRYVETFHHDLIPHLTSTKSPTHCLAAAIKTYFSKKIKVGSSRIKIVEIMPCIAKKYEATLSEMRIGLLPEIDFALTVREMAKILKDEKIDLPKLEDSEFDSPLGQSSGAAAIYGSSGGVMESALRTLVAKIGKSEMPRLEFGQIRGMDGIKESSVDIDGEILEIAAVSGLKNAGKLIAEIKSGVKRYDYIEVMACPGGCLGGGGQPIPTTPEIRAQRSAAYYTDDQGKEIRRAHENPDIIKMYQGLDSKPMSRKAKKLFHRKFRIRKPKLSKK
ncbi:ferredoxin [Candidatus Berkelbacteria bacterium CG08_land_8_20_14_0_20_39_8]|uniref:Ferredoxin n=1 Tax=Candidatus Berkelbacteria bacterium CG08_land_8_20_14_0_20_39_8 TaxID=1974511 RepID=A0A2M6YC25_9BACT|nr:MAG: ferredoxin [Candidatus Berkelbacteria bacterium CG08_land_8_20_14_0_20_39_8]